MYPNDEIRELIEVADGWAKEKQFDKTILLFLQAIEIDPNYCLSRVKLSAAYNIIGEYDAAIKQIKIALKKRPKDDPYPEEYYLFMLTGIYKTKKEYKMVIKTTNQIIKQNPLLNEAAFVSRMNEWAKKLGMNSTHFMNATGWPSENHYTTARDIAKLTRVLIKEFPEHYKLHAKKSYSYNGIKQYNRNKLLWRDKTVDGVKTGHTESAGYCLVASSKRNEMRLISVMLGTKTEKERKMANQAFC